MFSEEVLETLQFSRILEYLAGETHGPEAAEAALGIRPLNGIEPINHALDEVSEIVRHIEEGRHIPLERVEDTRPVLKRLAKANAVLDGLMLVVLKDMLGVASRCRAFLQGSYGPEKGTGPLADRAREIALPDALANELNRCLEDNGHVRSTASPALAKARREMESSREKVLDKFDRLIASPRNRKHLQEPVVMIRNGRYVLPVKREARAGLAGIVQDQSASGETLFIEPYSLVKMNNACQESRLAEEREVYRVLQRLTVECAENREVLHDVSRFVVQVDLAFARANMAVKSRYYRPEISDGDTLKLYAARHPLLGDKAVPVNIGLDGRRRCMVISGPNTGGKTLALKTVGLLVAMHQSGFYIPAGADSILPVFRQLYCDIGDMQSIDKNLSTFSAHLMRIADFISNARPGDLVLVDEIGSGTDMKEGNALALAVLDYLIEKQIMVMVTTHQSAIKEYAFRRDGAINAAVAFDYEHLRPLYSLVRGALGRSHAFMIARRLGFPENIISRANDYLSGDELKVEDLISRLEKELMQAEEAGQMLEERMRQAEEARLRYEDCLARREQGLQSDLASELSGALEHYSCERKRLQALMADFSRMMKSVKTGYQLGERQDSPTDRDADQATSPESAHSRLHETGQKLEESLKNAEMQAGRARQKYARVLSTAHEAIREGEQVVIDGTKMKGLVSEVRGSRLRLKTGDKDIWVECNRVTRCDARDAGKSGLRGDKSGGGASNTEQVTVDVQAPERIGLELMLIGLDAETAERRLEDYLDDAVAAGLTELRVVHGFGQGILKRMVAGYLSDHPMVSSFRPGAQGEGGPGATVVHIRGK